MKRTKFNPSQVWAVKEFCRTRPNPCNRYGDSNQVWRQQILALMGVVLPRSKAGYTLMLETLYKFAQGHGACFSADMTTAEKERKLKDWYEKD
jgi:hypothetical protein